MTATRQKHPRMKLAPRAYGKLWMQVLRRDGWRCQRCGVLKGLQVHHITPRSRLGDDSETNLITLCVDCHQEIHMMKKPKNRLLSGR
jgi:5-methylcytosine-specific restriction endonuclease McrA